MSASPLQTTDERARDRIRHALDESLIVEAAAGAGKTTELVRRIVNTLKSGKTTVDRIAAVTFTRKAAGELRLRLRIELDAARVAAPSSFLDDALARLEEARIGTIHSFCAELLRQRPVEARIPPGFEELDETQQTRFYNRAFDSWIQQALDEMPEGIRRVLSRGMEAESPLDYLRFAGRVFVEWRDFPAPWRREEFDQREEVDRLIPEIAELAAMAAQGPWSHPVRKHLQCVIDFMARVRRNEQTRPRDYDALEGLLLQLLRALRRNSLKGAKKYSSSLLRDDVLAAKERLVTSLEGFQRRADADLAALLQSELRGLVEHYEDLKAKSGKLDFGDLLIRARNLIRDDGAVRRFMQGQFQRIYVDEFQDTDPIQAEILLLLSADDPDETEWRAVRPAPGKLFLVGDPKQSIYRFRRADILMYQEVCRLLAAKGVPIERLSRSFRAVKPLQDLINAAFAPEMTGNAETGQPTYVALEPGEDSAGGSEQPSAVVLPAPFPYGVRQVSNQKIEECLPSAVAAYADWLIRESGWTVRDPATGTRAPIASQHIAILFRRFLSWGQDVTRDYVHELEARNIPHFLWGARSFHQREEVETVRVALNAIEWPDDDLSVYATLRGALFAISDNTLLGYKHRVGSLHPFHPIPEGLDADFLPLAETLRLLGDLHRRRNRRSIVETLNEMLETARAHASFALRPSGNQALANVYRIAELARAYETGDGYSFRGFVEQLNARAEQEDGGEAPVLEEGTEGVRIMTVHAAKGLEFPIVILADMTANIAPRTPDKHIDGSSRLCAVRVAGCSPWDLIDHEEEEHARDQAEGVRVAYVAATRARDLLVIPAVGDGEREGWIAPLNKAIYPPRAEYRASQAAPSCPAFRDASVLLRPLDFDGTSEMSVKPGLHANGVVWWDPGALGLRVEARFGLRGEEILSDDAGASLALYTEWKNGRDVATERGSQKSMNVFLATDGVEPPPGYTGRVQIERVARSGARPSGPRFGTLVHLILRDVDFGASEGTILQISRTHARLLNASDEEITAAAQAVFAALHHPLLERARRASRLYRELPVVLEDKIAGVLEAVIDLAFVEDREWHVIDFKTDVEDNQRVEKYRRQVGWYTHAIERTTGAVARGWILHL